MEQHSRLIDEFLENRAGSSKRLAFRGTARQWSLVGKARASSELGDSLCCPGIQVKPLARHSEFLRRGPSTRPTKVTTARDTFVILSAGYAADIIPTSDVVRCPPQ